MRKLKLKIAFSPLDQRLRIAVAVATLPFGATVVQAQALLSSQTYSQNFNGLSTTDATWSNNATLLGWYSFAPNSNPSVTTTRDTATPAAYAGTIFADAGASTSAGLHSYGAASNSDRALGSINSNQLGDFAHTLVIRNTTGATIDVAALRFTGEQWRNNGNTATQILDFDFRIFTTDPAAAAATNLGPSSAGYTDPAGGAFDFSSPIHTATASALDGNAAANRQTFRGLLSTSLNWQNNQYLVLRWWDNNDSGNDHGLSIDDLTLDSVASEYWDTNGETVGAGGAGTWDTTTTNFNSRSTGDGIAFAHSSSLKTVFGGTAGVVSIAAGGVTANAGIQFDVGGYSIASGGGALTLGTVNTITVTNAADTATVNAQVSSTTGLTKDGNGRLTLGGNNTALSGPINVNAGALRITDSGALGTTGAGNGTAVAAPAALELQNNISTAEAITLNGSGISNGGALRNISGDNTVSGAVNLNASSRVNSDSGNITLTGGIAGTNVDLSVGGAGNTTVSNTGILLGSGNLNKDGAGVLAINAASSYTGNTNLREGVIRLGTANALPTSTNLVIGSTSLSIPAELDLAGNNQTVASVASFGAAPPSGPAEGAAVTQARIISNISATPATLTINGSGSATYSDQIGVGGANEISIVRSGTGVQQFDNVGKAYTGTTTVNSGKLLYNASHTGGDDYFINGGTLGGDHSAGQSITPATGKSINIGSGVASSTPGTFNGSISPGANGNNSIGRLTLNTDGANDGATGVTNFRAGGAYAWEINDQTPDDPSLVIRNQDLLDLDAVTVSATSTDRFTIRIISLNASNANGAVAGFVDDRTASPDVYVIARSSQPGAFTEGMLDRFVIDTSQFANANPEGWSLSVNGSGTDLQLVYVPEPGVATFAALFGLAALRRRRRH